MEEEKTKIDVNDIKENDTDSNTLESKTVNNDEEKKQEDDDIEEENDDDVEDDDVEDDDVEIYDGDDDDENNDEEEDLRRFLQYLEMKKQKKKNNENKFLPCIEKFVKASFSSRPREINKPNTLKHLKSLVQLILGNKIQVEMSQHLKRTMRRSLNQKNDDDIKYLLCDNLEALYTLRDAVKIIKNHG